MVDTNSGFIVLYRKMIAWEWYTDANVMRVFIHCLLRANHKENDWRGTTIERGSFITSHGKLANELHLSVKQIRTSLDKLKKTNELAIKTTNKYSVITVNNYNDYQDKDKQTDKQTDKQEDIQRAIKGQSKGNQRATNNNDNNENNDNNDNKVKETVVSVINSIPNENLRKALKDFKEHRTAMKSNLTVRALKMVLTELDKLAKDDETKIAILNQSTMLGWKGVFPLKNNQPSKKGGYTATEPVWLKQHEEYRQSKKDEIEEVDPEELKKLLNSFKE